MVSARPTAFAGAVLAGGASRRMGRDKALVVIDGVPLVQRVAGALRGAGAHPVIVVGGTASAFITMGLDARPDQFPGEGPLGGVVTAFALLPDAEIIVVLATDLVAVEPESIATLVGAVADHDVAVPVTDGFRHFHHAAWRRSAQPILMRAFAGGERAIKRAVKDLDVVELRSLDAATLADADTPEVLARYTSLAPNRPIPSDHGFGSPA